MVRPLKKDQLVVARYNSQSKQYESLLCNIVSSTPVEVGPELNMRIIITNLRFYSELYTSLMHIEGDSASIRNINSEERTKERLDNLVGMQWCFLCSTSDREVFKRIKYTTNQDRIDKIRSICLSRLKNIRNELCKITCVPAEILAVSKVAFPR